MPISRQRGGLSALLFLSICILVPLAAWWDTGRPVLDGSIHSKGQQANDRPLATIRTPIPFGTKDGLYAFATPTIANSSHGDVLRKRDLTCKEYIITAAQDKNFKNCYHENKDVSLSQCQEQTRRSAPAGFGPICAEVTQILGCIMDHQIIWADQARKAGVQPGALKYIFKHQVTTEEIRSVMEAAAGKPDMALDAKWPGRRFLGGSEQFKALLGTPHGKGTVWLLIDHRNDMSNKGIEAVTMFTTNEDYNLLFTLDD
ncbi:MAG: hypothetical protein Q9181_002113 [Wetmoreana brouardii]